MKTTLKSLCLCAALCVGAAATGRAAAPLKVSSPDGKTTVTISATPTLSYSVSKDGKEVYTVKNLGLVVGGKTLTAKSKIGKAKRQAVSRTIRPVVPLKFSEIQSRYNEATIDLGNRVQLRVAVMDNAVAHRFITSLKGTAEITSEAMTIVPVGKQTCHLQQPGGFATSYEDPYQTRSLDDWKGDGRITTLPALLSGDDGRQLLIGESDVDDYPRMFLTASGDGISAAFPKSPEEWKPAGDRGETITKEGNYIAKTEGTRTMPWRWVAITDARGLVEQTIPTQLARPCALTDVSWIKPGQVSWEWWNGATPYGPDVDFKAGNNLDTYKFYVDFASRYGVRYILLDEGWAKSVAEPFAPKPELQLPKLIEYAKGKNVELILWLPWLTVEQNFAELFKTYASWGIHAVKIDFMDHSDQWMVNFYKRVAKEAAKYRIVVDFHGAFTPAGLEYEYPNILAYEGVRGLEMGGGCTPNNSTFYPFIRNTVGAMDFTPGAMNNYQPEYYHASYPNAGGIGTRANQLAMYVVFESGLQMLADNPVLYYKNDDCTRFITSVPTTWDETRCLAAEVGKYVVVAKRKGGKWFIGAMANSEAGRNLTVKLDFLPAGKTMRMHAFKDGVNADRQAMDYRIDDASVSNSSSVEIRMARSGGWAAVIE